VPTVLGAQPPSKLHSAILVNYEKILVVENGVSLNDSIWFLEVKTASIEMLVGYLHFSAPKRIIELIQV
jgi:guanylate kinase